MDIPPRLVAQIAMAFFAVSVAGLFIRLAIMKNPTRLDVVAALGVGMLLVSCTLFLKSWDTEGFASGFIACGGVVCAMLGITSLCVWISETAVTSKSRLVRAMEFIRASMVGEEPSYKDKRPQ